MTSKQKLLRLRDEVIAERIEQRKEKIRLIEKHNITVVPNNRCIRICMGNTVIDILLLSDEMYLSNYMEISCWVLCLISIDPKEIRDAISINK